MPEATPPPTLPAVFYQDPKKGREPAWSVELWPALTPPDSSKQNIGAGPAFPTRPTLEPLWLAAFQEELADHERRAPAGWSKGKANRPQCGSSSLARRSFSGGSSRESPILSTRFRHPPCLRGRTKESHSPRVCFPLGGRASKLGRTFQASNQLCATGVMQLRQEKEGATHSRRTQRGRASRKGRAGCGERMANFLVKNLWSGAGLPGIRNTSSPALPQRPCS